MRVIDILRHGQGKTLSVEIEPPLLGKTTDAVFATLDALVELGISYIDVTYHAQQVKGHHTDALGSKVPIYGRAKPGTVGIAGTLTERYRTQGVAVVPHVICTGFSAYDTEGFLVDLSYLGIENVLALRGDPRKDGDGKFLPFVPEPGGHSFAKELMRQIRDLREGTYWPGEKNGSKMDFCYGGACFPEGNSQASLEQEITWLKEKVDAGADYLVTQMFFDTQVYLRFRDGAVREGINVPLVPGLRPLSTVRHLTIFPDTFHCRIPDELSTQVLGYSNAHDVRQAGIDWCVQQSETLRKEGAPSLHFYASRNAPVVEVIRQLTSSA
ncbi:methylenetetrahydrofolate reductase [Candidatus Woesearchaeota archaeon]|nr:methylenetetrahydrofolate reductase [Candidatus Woesearchaeota archaeon]